MIIPSQITDSTGPLTAGLIISLINKYILNNPKLDTCCKSVEPEKVDSESESDETTKTEMSASLSRTSAITTATLPSHPIHMHHYYVQHF